MAQGIKKRRNFPRRADRSNWHPGPTPAGDSMELAKKLRRQSRWVWHALLLVLIVASPVPAEASPAADGTLVPAQAQSGSLFLQVADGYRLATTLNTEVEMSINGLVVRVSVRQVFENQGGDWVEGVYVFPLPDSAAVDQMRLHIGERFIEGEIREKEQARKEYEAARVAGKKASLVEQQRPNLFTTSVANIAPGEKVLVEIEYLESIRYADGQFSLRFPLTLTPRYMPGSPLPDRQGNGWSPDTDQVPDGSLLSPPMVQDSTGHQASFRIELNAGMPLDRIASRYHPVSVSGKGGRYRIELTSRSVPMDHDFELVWEPVASAAPRALAFAETVNDETYYLLMVMPPAAGDQDVKVMPREMIFIIDTSGSMYGTSLAQATRALQRALKGLRPIDRFNIVAFSSQTAPLFKKSQPVSEATLARAETFVASLRAEGGTEMRGALEFALRDLPSENHLRQLVFITDGAVGNEEALFTLIEQRLGQGRLFTVGIGSAPNSWFMRKAAEVGRGTFTMISALNEVGEKMDRLFTKIEQPQVTDIMIDWPASVVADNYPSAIPDLYADEPVSVTAKVTGKLQRNDRLSVRGNTVGGSWQQEIVLRAAKPGREDSLVQQPSRGVAALWARARISELLNQGRRTNQAEAVRSEVIATALTHHLVTQYTSLVAVDKTPVRATSDPLLQNQVPNRMAYGQNAGAVFGLPNTATNASRLVMTGMLFLVLALVVFLPGRRYREPRHVVPG